MDDDFSGLRLDDPGTCGEYTMLRAGSDESESDEDYFTPAPRNGSVEMQTLWSLPFSSSSSQSTAASSSSAGSAFIHAPINLAALFAKTTGDDSTVQRTHGLSVSRYTITEQPPIDGSTLEEQLDWVFEYALRIDKPWLNFPYKKSQMRYKTKRPDFAHLIRQFVDDKHYEWNVKIIWKSRRTAFDRMRGWFSRAYGVGAKKSSVVLADRWKVMKPQDIARWVFITRLEEVLYEPCQYKQKRSVRVALPSGVKMTSCVQTSDPVIADTVAVLLTYNTRVGQDDPTVLRWLQEGWKDNALFEKMMKHDLYKDVFEEFWEFQHALGQRLGFVHTAVCMEWSRHAEFPARVHLHAYHAPNLRFRSWDHHTPTIMIRQQSICWKNARPDVKPCVVKNRYKTAAVGTGLYYVTGKKLGTMYQRNTIQPFKDD
jgi:hypothetical protein